MNVTTVGEILQQARKLEAMAAECCGALADQAADQEVRMLAAYLGRHHRRLAETLGELPREEHGRICSVPIPYGPQRADFRQVQHMALPPDATTEQVLAAAMRLDEGLVALYRQVVRQGVSVEVKELFEALIRFEEADEVELRKLKAMGCA
jgi:hypothetical protein